MNMESQGAFEMENLKCPACGRALNNEEKCENYACGMFMQAPFDENFIKEKTPEKSKLTNEEDRWGKYRQAMEDEEAMTEKMHGLKKEKIEPIKTEEKIEIPEKLEKIISSLEDKIRRRVAFITDNEEAKEIKEKYPREWMEKRFIPRIIFEQEEKNIRIPRDWMLILSELEKRVPPAAKEFIRERKEEYENNLRTQGLL